MDLNKQLGATFIVVTHDIATAKQVADFIGMLYRRNLVKFGPAREMFSSDIPVVRQFLAGDTEGPIGMSEEKDSVKQDSSDDGSDDVGDTGGDGQATKPQSSRGMTAEETDEMERDAGATSDADATPGPRKKSF
jgi:phospholipid/cholesterol/gamma-HCH transport system ATP-binding protein